MLQLDESVINSLQALQDLADDLLEVSRSSRNDVSRSHCDKMSQASTINKYQVEITDNNHNGSISETRKELSNVSSKPNNVTKIYQKSDVAEPEPVVQVSDTSIEEKPDVIQNSLPKIQETVSSSEPPNNTNFNSVRPQDSGMFQQQQLPMTNLVRLLERRNDKLTSAQASDIAKKLFYMEGEEKRDIVRHLLQK